MKLLTLFTTMLGAVSAMPNLVQRDFAAQNTSINTVSSSYTKLQNAAQSFKPTDVTTLSGLLAIQTAGNQLQKDLQTAVSAMQGQQLSVLDSLSLLLTRLAFEPVLIGYLVAMIALKPTFDSVLGVFSVRKTILALLQEQDSLTQQMDQGIAAVMNPFVAYGMTAVALAEHVLFEATEAVYSIPAPAGRIELPAGQFPDPSALPAA